MEVLTQNETIIVSSDGCTLVSKTTTHQLTASGLYTVNVSSLIDSDDVVIASRVIEVVLPLPSPSPASTALSSYTPPPSFSPSQSVTSSPSQGSTDCYSLGTVIGKFNDFIV